MCALPTLHLNAPAPWVVEDIVAYVDRIGESAGLLGWSLGADLALAVAGTQPEAADAVVSVDPVLPGLLGAEEQAVLGAAIARMAELTAEGKLAEAARAFANFPFTDEDVVAADTAGYFEAAGCYVKTMLDFFRQQLEYEGATPDDPAVLGAITAPVLVLHGSGTKPYGAAAAVTSPSPFPTQSCMRSRAPRTQRP